MPGPIRILFLADSHLGFDLPVCARVSRRRRGHDFLANYASALRPALAGEVDLVVHGGDVFDRPGVQASVAYQAYEPLLRVAERGVPVFIVPGNHERSRLPHARLVAHPRVRVFDRPRTFTMEVGGTDVALSGFPFERRAVRGRVLELLEASGWRSEPASLRLLCMHQCVEGATVGPADYTFRTAPDVVCAAELPAGFSAVLSGHIHRHQVLTTDLRGRPLSTPVLYPGSIERTSLAELGEPKGFLLLHLTDRNPEGNLHWTFRPLPARPMIVQDIRVAAGRGARLDQAVRAAIAAAPADAVLRIRLSGELLPRDLRLVSAARLRTIAPATMNVEVTAGTWPIRSAQAVRSRQSRAARASTPADPQLQPLLWAGD